MKLQLKGVRFDTIEEIQKPVTNQLNKIPAEDFSNAMKKFKARANLCITSWPSRAMAKSTKLIAFGSAERLSATLTEVFHDFPQL